MRKYKVGDVIKFKDLSDVKPDDFALTPRVLQYVSNLQNQTIKEINSSIFSFRIDNREVDYWWFNLSYIDDITPITPQQKQHILQLIREI